MNEQKCRHFNGLAYEKCEAGINYMDSRVITEHGAQWPCFGDGNCPTQCAKFENYTSEEIAEFDRQINEGIGKLFAFENRVTNICPHCGGTVEYLEQVGRCVYTSCGCRLWQGTVPAAWKGGAS